MPSFRPALLILGYLLMTVGLLMLIPALAAWDNDPGCRSAFLNGAFATVVPGALLWLGFHGGIARVRVREIFVVTVTCWLVLPAFAAIPLMLGPGGLSLTDAVFESVSGITTTGSTVLSGLDTMAPSILLWRSMLQWMGGIGIIAMAVAVLPLLRVGGMRLFRTESSEWSEKAMPRTRKLAKSLLAAYASLSILCAFSYWVAGMSAFDAVNHAMTTVSTGGYSTSDASIGHFGSTTIQWIGILYMALGALPFVIYVRYWVSVNSEEFNDVQVRGFVAIVAVAAGLLTIDLFRHGDLPLFEAVTLATFNATSVITTTGYASADYTAWSPLAVAMFLGLTFVGGCSGSTAGGMKVFRFQLSVQLAREQVRTLVHPRLISGRRYNGRRVDQAIIDSIVTFSFLYFATLLVMTLALALSGLDLVTALSGSATALANVGPGLGPVIGPAGNFAPLPEAAKWILCAGMLLGRLELLSVAVLFSPCFWRG